MTNKERRIELGKLFRAIPGVVEAYFQPPPSVKMVYPCIRYTLSEIDSTYADDLAYTARRRYSVTVIDADPDSEIPDHIVKNFRYQYFERFYAAENLNHWVFRIYY